MNRYREIADAYFKANPEAKDDVMAAYYAYHAGHFRTEPFGHNFTSGLRESKCVWCNRSREMVRHDELPPICLNRPDLKDVAEVIRDEEVIAFGLFAKAEADVKRAVAKRGMSGDTLAILYHTHGHDPETVAAITEVSPQAMADFYANMEVERARSRASMKRTVVTVVT